MPVVCVAQMERRPNRNLPALNPHTAFVCPAICAACSLGYCSSCNPGYRLLSNGSCSESSRSQPLTLGDLRSPIDPPRDANGAVSKHVYKQPAGPAKTLNPIDPHQHQVPCAPSTVRPARSLATAPPATRATDSPAMAHAVSPAEARRWPIRPPTLPPIGGARAPRR